MSMRSIIHLSTTALPAKTMEKDSFYISKFNLTFKISVDENNHVLAEPHNCTPTLTTYALKLAGIERLLAQHILQKYKGTHPTARLMKLFDDRKWMIHQTS